ncbi:DUF7737 domain-containing protein [Actinoplanes xinjiangensis]|uniref:DUF7737 domain-containing protein n=1 Tax=Actinoplanes xinjiangensis TaxID=512350 RepID=UPI001A53CBED|nr:hypothetical protein Axi01nite_67500 [Actinoplanes xinjiangensis]
MPAVPLRRRSACPGRDRGDPHAVPAGLPTRCGSGGRAGAPGVQSRHVRPVQRGPSGHRASIHVGPAGYLCVVPAGFGATAHRRLFLPFADEDRMTSVILSKVLLLSEDDRITDPSILKQLKALT